MGECEFPRKRRVFNKEYRAAAEGGVGGVKRKPPPMNPRAPIEARGRCAQHCTQHGNWLKTFRGVMHTKRNVYVARQRGGGRARLWRVGPCGGFWFRVL